MKRQYFSIVEIIAAMAIVMILLGLVMGGASVANRMAKESRCRSQIAAIETALEQYRVYWGFYPEPDDDSAPMALTKSWFDSLSTDSQVIDNTQVGLNEDATYGYIDPYGQPFFYQIPGVMNVDKFDLWSKGRDTQHGEANKDDDEDSSVDNPSDAQSVDAKDSDDVTNWGRD